MPTALWTKRRELGPPGQPLETQKPPWKPWSILGLPPGHPGAASAIESRSNQRSASRRMPTTTQSQSTTWRRSATAHPICQWRTPGGQTGHERHVPDNSTMQNEPNKQTPTHTNKSRRQPANVAIYLFIWLFLSQNMFENMLAAATADFENHGTKLMIPTLSPVMGCECCLWRAGAFWLPVSMNATGTDQPATSSGM